MPWLILLLAVTAWTALHVAVLAIVSHRVGLRPSSVRYGVGPRLATPTIAGIPVELRPIPLGGSVENADIARAPLARRLTPGLVGALVLLVAGTLRLGRETAIDVARHSVVRVIQGALSPGVDAQASLELLVHTLGTGPHRLVVGGLAIWLGVWNLLLLPLPALARSPRLAVVAALAPLLLLVPWLVALVIYAT